VSVADPAVLLHSQTISLVVGTGLTGGAAISGGTWRLQYGVAGTYGVSNAASRRTPALPFDASEAAVRDALQAVAGIGAVTVARSVSRVQLYDAATSIATAAGIAAGTVDPDGAPLVATYDGVAADRVTLSAAPTAAQLSVADAVWVGDAAFRVRAFTTVALGAVSRTVMLLGTYAGGATPAASAAIPAFIDTAAFDMAYGEFVFRSGGGYSWAVSIHTTQASVPLSAFFAPGHSLVAALGGSLPVFVNITAAPCVRCVYTPQALLKGTPYYLRAWATNGQGRSAAPSGRVSEVPRTVPTAPLTVSATGISNSEIEVVWTDPADDGRGGAVGAGVAAFRVEWDPLSTFNSGSQGSGSGLAGTYVPPSPAGAVTLSRPQLAAAGGPPFAYVIAAVAGAPLANGTRLFTRVVAVSDVGFDSNALWVPPRGYADNRAWQYPSPTAATTAFRPPLPPAAVALELLSATSLRAIITPPSRLGGHPLDTYEVQAALSPAFDALSSVITRLAPAASLARYSPALGASSPVVFDVPGLVPGTRYYVRARAVSAAGPSGYTVSAPASETPRGAPSVPLAVRVSTASSSASGAPITSAAVTWLPPASTGGAAVSGYLVEAWSDRPLFEVQRLSVYNTQGRADTDCASVGAGSSFCKMTLRYGGVASVDFPLDESAADLRHHLMTLADPASGAPLLSNVDVSRAATPFGYEWAVTFSGRPGSGGLGDVTDLQLGSVVAQSASNCGAPSGPADASCIRVSVTPTVSRGQRAYGQAETQVVALLVQDGNATAVSAPTGFFRLSVGGSAYSVGIPVGAPSGDVEGFLASLPQVRHVSVVRTAVTNAAVTLALRPGTGVAGAPTLWDVQAVGAPGSGSTDGFIYAITYAAADGDVAGIDVDASRVVIPAGAPAAATLTAIASDARNGVSPSTGSPTCGACVLGERPVDYVAYTAPAGASTFTIGNLTAGRRYYAAVSAINDRGTGPAVLAACDPASALYCSPDAGYPLAIATSNAQADALGYRAGLDVYGLRLPLLAPGPPSRPFVDVDPGISSQLRVTYGPPASDGGSEVLAYRVEWSPAQDYTGSGGGKLDVPCPAAAPKRVLAVTAFNAASGSAGLSAGGFQLALTHGGVTYTTNTIRFDAEAARRRESDASGSRIFCETSSIDPVTSPVVCPVPAALVAPAAPGSLQSHLESLPTVMTGVAVSRAPARSGSGEYTWLVTFMDGGSDWTLAPVGVTLANAATSDAGAVNVTVVVPGQDAAATVCTGTQVIAGLQQGLPYYVRVTAYNTQGYGSPAAAISAGAGTPYQAPMKAPGRPTSVALTVKSGSELRVTWNPPLDNGGDAVTAYRIEYSTALDAGTGALTGAVNSVTVTYIPDSGPYTRVLGGLTAGTPYYVKVYAANSQGSGDGQQSTPTSEFPRTVPKAPLNVRLDVTRDSMLTVAYEPPLDNGGDAVTQFRIEWDTDPSWEGTGRLPHKGAVVKPAAGALFHTLTGLAPGQAYYVRVFAGNRIGFSLPSFDAPAGRVTGVRAPGRPFDIAVAASSSYCASLRVSFAAPVVPAHGLFCGGGGLSARRSPERCPAGMGYGTQADGGSRVTTYELQYATYDDFADAVAVSVPVALGSEDDPVVYTIGPATGFPLQPGLPYYVRAAARNSAGVGPFCARGNALCDGDVLLATASGACA
jgi:hypothetical protein